MKNHPARYPRNTAHSRELGLACGQTAPALFYQIYLTVWTETMQCTANLIARCPPCPGPSVPACLCPPPPPRACIRSPMEDLFQVLQRVRLCWLPPLPLPTSAATRVPMNEKIYSSFYTFIRHIIIHYKYFILL